MSTQPTGAEKAVSTRNFNQARAAFWSDSMNAGTDDKKPAGFGCGMGCGCVTGVLLAAAAALWVLWQNEMIEFYWPQWPAPQAAPAPPPTPAKGGK